MKQILIRILDYLVILFLIATSGAVISQSNNLLFLTILMALTTLKCIISLRKINKYTLILFLSLIILVFYTALRNQDYSYLDSYLSLTLQLTVALIVCNTIGFKHFISIYFNLIVLLAFFSFPFYLIGIIYPNFISMLPVLVKGDGVEYANAIFHVYPLPIWKDTLLRNNGLFWEPGAYQSFLNLAIIMFLLVLKSKNTLRRAQLLFLILCVITTGSTTGYFLLIMIFVMYQVDKGINLTKISVTFVSIYIIFFTDFFKKYFLDKFNSNTNGYRSFTRRNSDWQTDLEVSYNNMFSGNGFKNYYENFSSTLDGSLGGITSSSSNSVTQTIALLGLLFVLITLGTLIKFSINVSSSKIQVVTLFLFFFIVFLSQPLMIRSFWLVVIFFSLVIPRGDKFEENIDF